MHSTSVGLAGLAILSLTSTLIGQGMTTANAFAQPPLHRIGDVSGDGRDDLLVKIGSNFEVLDSTTNAPIPYLQRSATALPNTIRRYTPVGDYDGDGRDDLFHWIEGAAGVFTLVSGANGNVLLQINGPAQIGGGADFDGDGRSDLMLVTAGTARIRSSRTGADLVQVPSTGGTQAQFFTSVIPVGDENGDGCEDAALVFFGYGGNPYDFEHLVRGPAGVNAGTWNRLRPVGDVNADGKADFFCASLSPVLTPHVFEGGSLATIWQFPGAITGTDGAGIGDVDGDGRADITVYFFQTHQVFSGATQAPLAGTVPTHQVITLGDLDGDGRAECVMNGLRYEWSDPALPIASRMLRRGTPGTTNDGRRPYLVTRGHCGLGRTVFFDMRGGLPNGATLLFYGSNVDIDLAPLGAPDNRCYTSLAGGFAFVANANGVAQYQATMPVSPSLLGASLSLQAVVVDPAANALGLVTSNAIDLTTNN